MIQFTRSVCRQLKVIVKKALGRHKPDLRMTAGPEGLKVQAKGEHQAVEYHDPAPREPAELAIPFAVLEDVQGSRAEPVRLYCPKKTVLAATWEDRGVERTVQYQLPKPDETKFPDSPTSYSSNTPSLLRALHDASQCTDPTSSRYALGCIQFWGAVGQIAATDGRQLLLHRGYTLGFQEEVLAHTSDVFGCAELPFDQPVEIGKSENHLVVRVGPWSFYLELGSGRFPRVADIIPSVHSAKSTLELHPADALFFTQNVQRLPGSVEEQAITFECNGSIAVRAKTSDSPAAEILLTNSSKTGDDVTICLRRQNLVSATRMGFEKIYLYGKDSAVLARDEQRSYLFMPLEAQNSAVQSSGDCLRIPSPVCSRYHRSPSSIPTMNHQQPVSSNPATVPTQASATSQEAARVRRRRKSAAASVLDQAITVRDQLRETLGSVKDLVRVLKSERRSQKSLKLALASLTQLQQAA